MQYIKADVNDGLELAELRAVAMKPSLLAIGRFDEDRVRSRFLATFQAEETVKLIENDILLGFYVVRKREDHFYLDHLYIKPDYQGRKLGQVVIAKVIAEAKNKQLPVRLGALKGSRANDFYIKQGFSKTHEDEFDIYYQYSPSTN